MSQIKKYQIQKQLDRVRYWEELIQFNLLGINVKPLLEFKKMYLCDMIKGI